MSKPTPEGRDDTIIQLRQDGWKLSKLAFVFNISKGRVWQITTNYKRRVDN